MRVHACAWLCMCACMCGGSACVPGHGCACPSVPARARGCIHARVCLDTCERGGGVHVCSQVHACVCVCTHVCVLERAAGLCVRGAAHPPTATTSGCGELARLAHACLCDPCPAGSCARKDGRTEGASSPGQETNGSHGKRRTLPAPCLSSRQLPADAAAAGAGGRAAAARFSCAARWARGTGRASPCLDPPGPPDPGSDSAGRHEAQPGAAASQTSLRSLRRAADLSGCQDTVVFGITALPADPAKQTGHRAEGGHAGRAVPRRTALGMERAAPGGGLGVDGGQGAAGTLHGTQGTRGTWPEHGVAAVTPWCRLASGGHPWGRGAGRPKSWVLPPAGREMPPAPPAPGSVYLRGDT